MCLNRFSGELILLQLYDKKHQVKIPPPQIDQIKILQPSVHFNSNLLSAACKILYSDWLKIRTQTKLTSSPLNGLGRIIFFRRRN